MKNCVKIMATRRIIYGFKDVAEGVRRENHNVYVTPNTLFPAVVQCAEHLQDIRQSGLAIKPLST